MRAAMARNMKNQSVLREQPLEIVFQRGTQWKHVIGEIGHQKGPRKQHAAYPCKESEIEEYKKLKKECIELLY